MSEMLCGGLQKFQLAKKKKKVPGWRLCLQSALIHAVFESFTSSSHKFTG